MAKTRSNSSGVISEICPKVSMPELEITTVQNLRVSITSEAVWDREERKPRTRTVDVLEMLVCLIEELHDVRGPRYIGCDSDGFAAKAFNLFDDL